MNEGWPLCVLGITLVGLPALIVLMSTLAPGYVARSRQRFGDHPWSSFLLGLVNLAFFGALGALQAVRWVPLQFIGAASLVIVLPAFLMIGLLVTSGVVGERLWRQLFGRAGGLLGTQLLGMFIMVLALLVPIFGWLLVLALLTAGLGAGMLGLFNRRGPAAAAFDQAVTPPEASTPSQGSAR